VPGGSGESATPNSNFNERFLMKRKVFIFSSALIVSIVGSTIANAHIEFNPDFVLANKNQVLSLVVPHDCSANSKTTEVKLQLPAAFNIKSFAAVGVYQHGKIVKNWSEKIVSSGGKSYLDIKGPGLMAGPDMGANSLTLKFKATTPSSKGAQLAFPAVQYCTGGASVSWIQPRPADGSDPAESSKPVPVLNLK